MNLSSKYRQTYPNTGKLKKLICCDIIQLAIFVFIKHLTRILIYPINSSQDIPR